MSGIVAEPAPDPTTLYQSEDEYDDYVRRMVQVVAGGNLCLLCGKVLCNKFTLKRHFISRHVVRTLVFLCPDPACSQRRFGTRSNFYNHIVVQHPDYRGLDLMSCAVARKGARPPVTASAY